MPLTALALLDVANAGAAKLHVPWAFWIGFGVFVAVMLGLDLGVFNRKHHVVKVREAMLWTGMWVALALLFAAGLYFWQLNAAGHAAASEIAMAYLAGYIVELSLSVDNLFVIAMVFSYFGVPRQHQHSVLFWGIIGALLMRGALIFLGLELIHRFHFMIYVFGAFLVLTGIRMVVAHGREIKLERSVVVRLLRRLMPVSTEYAGGKFFVRRARKLLATPLFVALLIVEFTDLLFAVDSIPAILAITEVPFVVVTSNAFAVLGLRSMFFALSGFLARFHLLHFGLSAVLVFIGVKMMLADTPYAIAIPLSLLVVVVLLGSAIAASLIFPPDDRLEPHGTHADGTEADVLPEELYKRGQRSGPPTAGKPRRGRKAV